MPWDSNVWAVVLVCRLSRFCTHIVYFVEPLCVFLFFVCLQLNFWFVPTLYFVEPFSVCLLVLFTNELHQLKVDVGMLTPRRFIELTFRALALRQSFFALTKG